MTKCEPLTILKLSIQRALLGEITDRVEAVTCGVKGTLIQIRAYFRGMVEPSDVDRIQSIGAEVIADFPEGHTIQEYCVSVDGNQLEMLDFWAFRRSSG